LTARLRGFGGTGGRDFAGGGGLEAVAFFEPNEKVLDRREGVMGDAGIFGESARGGVETRFCSLAGRKLDKEGALGTGACFAHTWSPNSWIGTGAEQLEHLTDGKSWEILPEFSAADGGERRDAMDQRRD